jgi:non-heme chloroperoxidase
MKNKTILLLLIVFCLSSKFSSAQTHFHDINHWSMYKAIAGEQVVKLINLPTGVALEYIEQGDANGIPVIFLHGYTDSWHSFETVLPLLPDNIHAIAVTQRGHGNSSKPAGNYHPRDFAKDIAALIEKKNLGPVIIAGHSLGGVVAQQFALDYPQLTRGIVLISTDASFKNNPGMPEFKEVIGQLTDPISYEFVNEFQKSTCAKPIDTSFYQMLVGESMKLSARVWKAVANGFMNVDYSRDLAKINKPALVLWGDKDAICSGEDQDILVKGIKNSKLLIYSETGHALHWEEPARFADDIINFISTIR